MARGGSKEVRRVLAALKARGMTIRNGGRSSHHKVYLDGRMIAVVGDSPSDGGFVRALEKDLRRAGALSTGERLL